MSVTKGADTMAKEQFTPEEIEHIEGKELPKTIHYLYICNQRSVDEELKLFVSKWAISLIFIFVLFMFFPSITDFVTDFWKSLSSNFNGAAY